MRIVLQWIKTHKIIVFLIIIIGYFWLKNNPRISLLSPRRQINQFNEQSVGVDKMNTSLSGSETFVSPPFSSDYAPAQTSDRMVVQNSSLSLLVDDVPTTQTAIIQKTQELGGYMVNSYLTRPQDAPNGTLTLRIPSKNMDSAMSFFRSLAVKVISENLEGEDVTDQYVDIDARMTTLIKTKTKFEEIMDQAIKVQDILEVQRELINLQSQIDHLKGQQNYLVKNAEMSKITIYLSTDELALPYAPTESWRPNLIFKEAIRSFIGTFRKIGTAIIWLGVYAVIWIPLTAIILVIRKRRKNTTPSTRLN